VVPGAGRSRRERGRSGGAGRGPAPLLVAPPGDPQGGFDPDAPALFWIGGDEWWTYNVRCDREDVTPVLVVTAAESLPHDDPDAEWHVHETILRLTGATPQDAAEASDGMFEVISMMDYTSSMGSPGDDHLSTDGMLCGERLNMGGVAGGP
jgi:hypothetical protein